MDIFTLLLLGLLVAALPIIAFFALLFLALLIYVISHAYPWLRNIAVWAAKPENLFSLLTLAIILIIVGVLAFAALGGIMGIFFGFMLILIAIFLFIPVGLGILVWIIRLVRWVYRQWRGWLVGIYAALRLQTIKFKIKVDVHKEKEADWKVKWAEMKNKLSQEVEQARRRIYTRRK